MGEGGTDRPVLKHGSYSNKDGIWIFQPCFISCGSSKRFGYSVQLSKRPVFLKEEVKLKS